MDWIGTFTGIKIKLCPGGATKGKPVGAAEPQSVGPCVGRGQQTAISENC